VGVVEGSFSPKLAPHAAGLYRVMPAH
jgi:hypothetical protein